MNVLLISYFFPPDNTVGGFRASSFAKHFHEKGLDIILLTANAEISEDDNLRSDFNPKEVYYAEQSRLRQIGYKTRILIGLELLNLDKLLFFPDIYFPWKKRAVEAGKKAIEENDIDAIFTTAPPYTAFEVGYKLSKEYNIPLILDYRDPWTSNPNLYLPRVLVKSRHKRLEQKIAKHANMIITVGRECAEIISKTSGIEVEDFYIVPNGYFAENKLDSEIPKISEKFVVSFFGSYYKIHKKFFKEFVQGVRIFVDKLKLTTNDLTFNYAGGVSRSVIRRDLEIGNLFSYFNDLGILKGKKLIQEVSKSHINFLISAEKAEYATLTKTYDYALGNSHILIVGNQGAISNLCEELEQKYTIVSGKREEIAKTLGDLYEKWKNNKLEYGCNKDKLERYNRKNISLELAKEN